MKQRLSVIAFVAGLHLAAVWLLLSTTLRLAGHAGSESLQLLLLGPPSAAGRTHPQHGDRATRAARTEAPSRTRQPNGGEDAVAPEAAPPNDAMYPPIDWDAELSRAAKGATAAAVPPPREFGFPRRPEGAVKAPEFAWSQSRTHRIELLPEGGLLIHLNDRCVLVFFPLPFAFCGVGKISVNGALFEHMHDPERAGDWQDASSAP